MPFTGFMFPPYSFVQAFEPGNLVGNCDPSPGVCLPFGLSSYLSTQMHLKGFTSYGGDVDPLFWLSPVATDGPSPALGSTINVADYPIFIYALGMANNTFTDPFGSGTYTRTIFFNRYMPASLDTLANPIGLGDCFRFAIIEGASLEGTFNPLGVVRGYTNCFIREDMYDCHMSFIVYRCNEDSHGFDYDSLVNYWNMTMLPFYLKKPQLESEENSYRKSDGTFIKLYERVDEIVELETDWRPYDFHKKLKVALSSDLLNVYSASPVLQQGMNIPINFFNMSLDIRRYVCREAYEIEWQDFPYRNAKGKTKLITSEPLILTNTNCKG